MKLNLEVITSPPRDAATVVMLRDAPAGLEVFLLKRHGNSDILGGAYVFPGGKVDTADAELDLDAYLDQPPQALRAALAEPDIDVTAAASLYVAAVRETFEESGVLFVQGATAGHAAQASVLLRGGLAFAEVLARLSLRLDTRSVLPWSRWITPTLASVSKKRFDTRFFVAAVPLGQTAHHDEHEATESVWLTPHAALTQYWNGEIQLAPPQIMSLVHLTHHVSVKRVLDAARLRQPPVIQPEPFEQEDTRVVCYPGDERHSVFERALPGPTRLYYRNKRFEPNGGFQALLA